MLTVFHFNVVINNMQELETLQKESDKLESLIEIVSYTDMLDTDTIETHSRKEDIILNGSHKAYNLGVKKGIEMVEEKVRPALEKFINKVETGRARSTETYNDMKEILEAINKLKEELK